MAQRRRHPGAVRSGFLRPPGVGPRELTPSTTSSLGVTVPTSLKARDAEHVATDVCDGRASVDIVVASPWA